MSQRCYSNCNSRLLALFFVVLMLNVLLVHAVDPGDHVDSDLQHWLGKCHIQSSDYNGCMQQALNDMRSYFQSGLPTYHVKPFEPHHSDFVELRRGYTAQGVGSFHLVLRNVTDHGWLKSKVTKFEEHFVHHSIVFSQYFPQKHLEGEYEFTAAVLGTVIKRQGAWNLTLHDYSQTTTVTRVGGPGSRLKVHVEIDNIGGLEIHAGNLLAPSISPIADTIVNGLWALGLPFLKPLLNELVSTAFTDIFNDSFRNFPFEKFLSAK